jgi:chromosome segregation ATPase
VQEQAEAKVQAEREKLDETASRADQLQGHVACLQEEIAESPEGLEEGIKELQAGIRLQKARVEEKTDEKRARTQRVHGLGRVKSNIDNYQSVLEKMGETIALQAAASDRTRGALNELATLRSSFDARKCEEIDLMHAIEQISSDMDAAKQAHEAHVQECEERRQQAMSQHKELLEKRTEEQRQADALLAQRNQLEAEIASVKRAHEEEMSELHMKLRRVQDGGEEYIRTIEGMIAHYNAETGRASLPACFAPGMPSPGSAYAHRKTSQTDFGAFSYSPSVRSSPAPRRLILGTSGLN